MPCDHAAFGFFKDSPDAFFVIDPAGTILDANRVFAAQFSGDPQGYPRFKHV